MNERIEEGRHVQTIEIKKRKKKDKKVKVDGKINNDNLDERRTEREGDRGGVILAKFEFNDN